jgi:lipid-A-disaccharide synthase
MTDHHSNKSVVIIAGEVSGDIHGSRLIAALKSIDPQLQVHGIGGDLMIKEGLEPVCHIEQMAFLGVGEILKHLPFIRRVFKKMTDLVLLTKPAAVILIDYPGFNLRFAKKVKDLGIPVIYYISPQLWAWGKRRVYKIKKYVQMMLVIFPFEKDFYRKYGISAAYVGHPLVDNFFDAVSPKKMIEKKKVLGLLPGSRKQELEKLLPDMVRTAKNLKTSGQIEKAVILKVSTIPIEEYQKYIPNEPYIQIHETKPAEFYNTLDAALVSSGTATLETAYFQVPMVIVYRVGALTWFFGRLLVKLDTIGLANIVAGEPIAIELLQKDFNPQRAESKLRDLLDPARNAIVRQQLAIIKDKLGTPGASQRAAELIVDFISG